MEKDRIIYLFENLYNGKPWGDMIIVPTLNKISANQASTKVLPNCNSIWEIVNHIIRWRENVLERIQGRTMDSPPTNYFEPITDSSEAAWTKTLEELHNTQKEWIKVLHNFEDGKLEIIYTPNNVSYYEHIHGIMHHDAYHLGQIVMLLKFV